MRTLDRPHIPSATEVIAAAAADTTTAYGAALAASRPKPVPQETSEERIARLETELAAVKVQTKSLSDLIEAGNVEAASCVNLTELAERSAELQGQLTAARKVTEDAAFNARQELREQRKAEFRQMVEQARQSRAEFRRAFALAAAALGAHCHATEQAVTLNHQLREHFPLPDVERDNDIRDVTNRAALSPLPELLDAGFSPLMGFGFDLVITLPPLSAPGTKEK